MITRKLVIKKAIDECIRELYSKAQPTVKYDDFINQCREYNKKYIAWLASDNKEPIKNLGPKPFEFYYLPRNVFKDIADSYVYAYKLDGHKELEDTISILKGYFNEPVVDKYIDDWTDEYGNCHPGYRGYDYPDNLEKEIKKILGDIAEDNEYYQHKLKDKVFEFFDMAQNFYNWNGELNTFNMSVYLGATPTSNKELVIKNWKEYRNIDITIDDSLYEEWEDDEWEDEDLNESEE